MVQGKIEASFCSLSLGKVQRSAAQNTVIGRLANEVDARADFVESTGLGTGYVLECVTAANMDPRGR